VADDSMPADWDEPLVKLYRTVWGLCSRTVAGLCGGLVGDADVDALIAATLGVQPHPYTPIPRTRPMRRRCCLMAGRGGA
jgi:hypothetical protein